MKNFAVAVCGCDGEIYLDFIKAVNKFDALKKYAKREDYDFGVGEYGSYDELVCLFNDCDQSVIVKEIEK